MYLLLEILPSSTLQEAPSDSNANHVIPNGRDTTPHRISPSLDNSGLSALF